MFNPADIDAALVQYDISQYPALIQGVMGLDPGSGVSSFGIVVVRFVDGLIRVAYADEHRRSDHSEMLSVVWDLVERHNVTKVLVDASAPSFIRALKLQLGERSDYENVEREVKRLLYHVKFLLENKYLQIHPSMDKLITALRTSWAKDGVLDKEVTSHNDVLDAFASMNVSINGFETI